MLQSYRDQTNLQKYILLLSVFGLASFLGSLWLGWVLSLWILIAGGLIAVISLNSSPTRLLKWQGATKLNRYYYGDLYDSVNVLASRAGLSRSPDIYFLNNQAPNAFAIGNKERPVIGVSQGLVNILNARELRAVLAHEISHIKNNDLLVKGLALSFGNLTHLLSWIGKLLLLFAVPMYLLGIPSFSLAALLLMVFSPTLNLLLQLGLSRSMEFLADHDAAILTEDPLALASALDRIDTLNRPWWHNFYSIRSSNSDWLRSHPRTAIRIERLKSMVDAYKPRPTRRRVVPISYPSGGHRNTVFDFLME